MNGVHDLGGMHGFGPINPEPEEQEPVFHADWERRVFGLVLACGALGGWTIDRSRHARERLDPLVYLGSTYYERWLAGLELLLVHSGMVMADELATGCPNEHVSTELTGRRLSADRVPEAIARGAPVAMVPTREPRFQKGDRIRVRPVATDGHHRAVRYAQGRFGTVTVHHGCHVFPDRNSEGDRVGEHLYGVVFAARELWGEAASPRDAVHVDLWEPYLEPVL